MGVGRAVRAPENVSGRRVTETIKIVLATAHASHRRHSHQRPDRARFSRVYSSLTLHYVGYSTSGGSGHCRICVCFSHGSLAADSNFCPSHAQAQSRHSSLRRVLVLPGGMPLLHETSSTATHHPLPNGLPVINLHMTKPVCACAAQRPLNASASRPGDASTREAPSFPRSLPCSPGPTVPMKYTRFVGAPLLQTPWATEI